MKKKFKSLFFALAMILILPCVLVFAGCKPTETGFYVVYNGVQINGGTLNLSFDSTDTIDIEGNIQAYVTLKKKADKKLDLSSLEISSNIKETVEPGDEYQVEIKYKKFNAVKINIKINKLENDVTIQNSSKVYDGQPFKTEDLEISATNQTAMTVSWFKGETALAECPTDAGKYRVKVSIPEIKKYKGVEKFIDVEILKAEPNVDWSLISVSAAHLSTDKLSSISLPEGFAWKNPETLLSVGTNSYTVVYTPADTNYLAVEKDIEISAKQAFFLPTQKEMRYTGETIELKAENLVGFNSDLMEIKDGVDASLQINAGTYNVKIGFKAGVDACWADGTTEDKDFVWTISKAKVKVPFYKAKYILMPLSGNVTISWENAEEVFKFCYLYNGDGNTNTKTYSRPVNSYLEFALLNEDNCEWEDGTTERVTQRIEAVRDVFECIKYVPFGGTEQTLTTLEFLELEKVCVGSTFEFVLKDKTMILKINNEVCKDCKVVVNSDDYCVYVDIYSIEDESDALFRDEVEIYFYATTVKIEGKEENITLSNNDFYIDLKEDQESITIELAKELEGFKLSLVLVDQEDVYKRYPINSLTVVVRNLENVKMIIIQEDKEFVSLVQINITKFTRIEEISVIRMSESNEEEIGVNFDPESAVYVNRIIKSLNVKFKDGYENATFVLQDKNGNIFTDFNNLNGKENFFILVKVGDAVVETIKVEYDFLGDVSFLGQKNTIREQIDYFNFYVQVDDLADLENKARSSDENVQYVINNGEAVSFDKFGMYRVPISFTYTLYDNFTVTYSTTLIVNYSKNIKDFVEDASYLKFTSSYLDEEKTIYLNSYNYAGGSGLGIFRALLTDGQYTEGSLIVKEGYTLKSVAVVATEDMMFGYRVIFDNKGTEETCYIYEAVSGIYNSDTGISRVKIVSYFGESRDARIDGDTIYVDDLRQLENLAIFTSNDQTIVKIEDANGKVIVACAQEHSSYVEAYFPAKGTYQMVVISPNGTEKTYQIIVTGDTLDKPFATISAGTDDGKVTLQERYEKLDDGDYDFNGDFIIDDSGSAPIFNGYFGEAMLSEIKTVNGKEYLDVTVSSVVIENFYLDEDCLVKANDGLNTLEVFETEGEQPVKFVRLYVTVELMGLKVVVSCNVFLADLPEAGE